MIRARHTVAVLLTAALAACGAAESPTAPVPADLPNPEPSLVGTFHGMFNGLDQGVMLAASLQFSLTEASGVVIGTFAVQGRLDDGQSQTDVAGTGILTGTVASGDVATVSFTTESDLCPGHTSAFTGIYFRLTGVLGVEGRVDVVDPSCTVVLTFPIDLAMRR